MWGRVAWGEGGGGGGACSILHRGLSMFYINSVIRL